MPTPSTIYLDHAATGQMPPEVLAAMNLYYTNFQANVHRSSNEISNRATSEFENARTKIAEFLGVKGHQICFTSGATMGLNILALSLEKTLTVNDTIVLSRLEHHSNLLPWVAVAKRVGCSINWLEVDENGTFIAESIEKAINENTKVVAVTHASNVTGEILPIEKIIARAKKVGAITIVDGAQSAMHLPINLAALECDAFVCSAHKMGGPTGIGILFLSLNLQKIISPLFWGGGMIGEVKNGEAPALPFPYGFEAGTQNIAGAIGMGAVVDYLKNIGWEKIQTAEKDILEYTTTQLESVEGLKIIGPKSLLKTPVVSFYFTNVASEDIGNFLGQSHIAVRIGVMCASMLFEQMPMTSAIRASFNFTTKKRKLMNW